MALAEFNYNDVKARMVRAVEQEASQMEELRKEARTRAKQLQDEAGALQQESANVMAVARRNMVDRLAKPDKGDSR